MKRRVILVLVSLLVLGCVEIPPAKVPITQPEARALPDSTTTVGTKEKWLGELCPLTDCLDYCKDANQACDFYCLDHPENDFCQEYFSFVYDNENLLKEQRVHELRMKIADKDCSNFFFKEHIVNPQHIKTVTPLGTIHGSGRLLVGRSYVSLNQETDIIAPTDMILIAGGVDSPIQLETNGFIDYTLVFDVGCDLRLSLDHVKTVVPKIEQILPTMLDGEGWPQVEPMIIAKGEKLGTWTEGKGTPGFDFIVEDLNFENSFVNQERYVKSNLLNIVCPFDMYPEAMKNAYYSKIGGGGGTLFKNQECLSVRRDTPGSIEGQWFLNEEPTPNDVHEWYEKDGFGSPFPIIGDEERITIGWIQGTGKTWIYPNYPTYKDAKEVTDKHCYQIHLTPSDTNGYIFFKMLGDNEMEVAYSDTGNCPSNFPGGRKYYR